MGKYAQFAVPPVQTDPPRQGGKYRRFLEPPPPLTMDQEAIASAWAQDNALIRKHYGEKAGQYVGPADTPEQEWESAVSRAKAHGWKPPEKSSIGDALITGTNDLTFGFSDEVGSGAEAAASFLYNLPGKGFSGAAKKAGETFDKQMDYSNYAMERARQDRPLTTLAPVAGAVLAAPLLGARAAVGSATTTAPARAAPATFWGKVRKGATDVAKIGAVGAGAGEVAGVGAARGNLPERIKEAGWEAPLFGAGAGYLFAGGGKLLGSAIKGADDAIRPIFMDPGKRELFQLERAMRRDNVSIEDLQSGLSRVKRMGGDTLETLAEIAAYSGKSQGTNLRRLSRALASVPGRATELAEQLVAKRRASIHKGASKAVAAGTGKKVDDYADEISELEANLKRTSDDAYDAFRAATIRPDIFERQIAPILASDPGKAAMTAAAKGLRMDAAAAKASLDDNLAKQLDDAAAALERNTAEGANRIEMIPPRALDEVKKAFDDQIEAAGQRSYTGKILRGAKNKLAERVSSATDGLYGQALGVFSGGKRLRESIDTGYSAFNMKPWQLEQALEGTGGPGGMLTQEEFEGFAFGFARALQDKIDANDISAVRGFLRNKAMQAKLKEMMGSGYAGFMSRMQRIVNRQDFDNFVTKGSPTARIQADIDDATDEDVVTRVFENLGAQSGGGGAPSIRGAIASATIKPIARGAADFWRKLRYRGIGDPEINERLGKRMFTPMTDTQMRQLRRDLTNAPQPRLTELPDRLGLASGVAGAQAAGRDAVDAGQSEDRAEVLVEDFDAALMERYLDPSTSPEELKAIEAHFGPQAAELYAMRLQRMSVARGAGAPQ